VERDPSHWLSEDDFDNQGDWPPSEDDEFDHNELGPKEFEPQDDDYEVLVP